MLRKIVKILPLIALLPHPSEGKLEYSSFDYIMEIDGVSMMCTQSKSTDTVSIECGRTWGLTVGGGTLSQYQHRGLLLATSNMEGYPIPDAYLYMQQSAWPSSTKLERSYRLQYPDSSQWINTTAPKIDCTKMYGCDWELSTKITLVVPRYINVPLSGFRHLELNGRDIVTGLTPIGASPNNVQLSLTAYYKEVKPTLTVDVSPHMINLGVVPSSETSVRDVDLSVKVGDVPDNVTRRVNVKVDHAGDGAVRVYDGPDELIDNEIYILNTKKLQLRINHGAKLGPKEHNVRFTVSVH